MSGITDEGFDVPVYETIQADLRAEFEAEEGSGVTPSYARGTILGAITTALAIVLANVWEALRDVYDSYRVSAATGRNLDNLCELVGVVRREATNSTVSLTCNGVAATVIPSASLVEDTAGNTWRTRSTLTLNGSGTGSVAAECTSIGAISAPAGTITTIRSPVSGWTTVTNVAAATTGFARETDTELRQRRLSALSSGTNGTRGGIKSLVESVGEVDVALVADNSSGTTTTVGAITLPPNSLAVVVFPASLSAEAEDEIAEAIYASSPAGIEMIGTETVTVNGADGGTFDVKFNYATSAAVTVNATVVLDPDYDLDEVRPNIEDEIAAHFATLSVGDDVYHLQLLRAVGAVAGVLGATITMDAVLAAGPISTTGNLGIPALEYASLSSVLVST